MNERTPPPPLRHSIRDGGRGERAEMRGRGMVGGEGRRNEERGDGGRGKGGGGACPLVQPT